MFKLCTYTITGPKMEMHRSCGIKSPQIYSNKATPMEIRCGYQMVQGQGVSDQRYCDCRTLLTEAIIGAIEIYWVVFVIDVKAC